ncbi:CLUMA_CG009593, isoform A [Clunio marinus]|uniref:CLUMA_CG009593, isoform A n=1 Tax=Clunio marinus TaxID=568069 RepID=A0A1J1I9B7_9DIPT|nr:CLUMA_CG009593, isoform A [Clunio marinus]
MKIVIAILLIACVISVIESQTNPGSSSGELDDLVLSGPGAEMIANQGIQKREACNRDDDSDDDDDDDRRRK